MRTKNKGKPVIEHKKEGDNLPVKEPASQVVKKLTLEETRNLLDKITQLTDDPTLIVKELSEKLPDFYANNMDSEAKDKILDTLQRAAMAYSLDTQGAIVGAVGTYYKPLAIEVARQLAQEFQCKTASEKALSQLAASAYVRTVEMAARVNRCIEFLTTDGITNERIAFLSVISKYHDRCNRQFMAAITTLKQTQSPTIEFNIKSKTAFVSQNQQINAAPEPGTSENATS